MGEATIKVFRSSQYIPFVGQAYVIAVADKIGPANLIAEAYVLWFVGHGNRPHSWQRFNYHGAILRFQIPGEEQLAVNHDRAIRDVCDWASGQIDCIVFDQYQQLDPRPPYPQWNLIEGKKEDIFGLWLRNIAAPDLQAMISETASDEFRSLLQAITRMPHFTAED